MPARARGSMSVSNTTNSTPTRSNQNFTRSESSLASLTNELVSADTWDVACTVMEDIPAGTLDDIGNFNPRKEML